MPMNTTNSITHIHLKKEEESIQVYLVDNTQKVEERITLLPSELKLPLQLSRAIVFVKNEHLAILQNASLLDQVISTEVNGITSVLINKSIHQYFEGNEDLFLELNGKETKEGAL